MRSSTQAAGARPERAVRIADAPIRIDAKVPTGIGGLEAGPQPSGIVATSGKDGILVGMPPDIRQEYVKAIGRHLPGRIPIVARTIQYNRTTLGHGLSSQ
jgi:hypothetical protein